MRENPRLAAIMERKEDITTKLKSGQETYKTLYAEISKDVHISYETFCRYLREHLRINKPSLGRFPTTGKKSSVLAPTTASAAVTTDKKDTPPSSKKGWTPVKTETERLSKYYVIPKE